jgi:glutamate racemase
MIGLLDSGHGGLTVLQALRQRFPYERFVYFGDHSNAPYGDRSSEEIVQYTIAGVEFLYTIGARLVIIACNTATAVACRTLQQQWLPDSQWQNHNVLGIIAPTVEAATQTPWAVTEPQYPQKFNKDVIAVFATTKTVESDVFREEILKRCPRARVLQQPCPQLAGAIENSWPVPLLDELIQSYVRSLLDNAESVVLDRVILGCTHYQIVQEIFRRGLPGTTRIMNQPTIVADSLEHYLACHPEYSANSSDSPAETLYFTSGKLDLVKSTLKSFEQPNIEFQTA